MVRAGVILGVAVNLILVLILLLVSGWVEPTTLGIAFVLAQAVVVALFAEAEYVGLRRTQAAPVPA